MMKRIFDLVFSLAMLLLLWPLLLLLALLVKMEDGDRVIFRHERIGRYGKPFSLFKLRTMTSVSNQETGSYNAGDTSRVTKTGKYLRRLKLDELPQLVNVVRGDMSLVGPRPEVAKWINTYPERWEKILEIRPGITDNASIQFRNEEEILSRSGSPEKTYRDVILPEKLSMYEIYLENRSFTGDLGIILKTFFIIFSRKDTIDADSFFKSTPGGQ